MPDTIIPVTYAGGSSYSLAFREGAEGLQVRRSYDKNWKPVADLRATLFERQPGMMVVEINCDLRHGVPIFVWMKEKDWETVRRMKDQSR